jgi:pimeloyl-ACP methyl ester carboxylesterase
VASFCLVHGAWHDGSCWERVVAGLAGRGHIAVAPDLPFHDPQTGFEDRVRPALEAIAGVADPVVVVGHSMASHYAPLVAAARPGSLLVHLCPAFGRLREGFPFPPKSQDGTRVWDAEMAIDAMYPRLPPATARRMAQRLRPMAPAADDSPLSGHPDVPTALVYAADDEFFEPASERSVAREMLGIEPIEIAGGHFPMVEDPEALVDLLDRLAREHASLQPA